MGQELIQMMLIAPDHWGKAAKMVDYQVQRSINGGAIVEEIGGENRHWVFNSWDAAENFAEQLNEDKGVNELNLALALMGELERKIEEMIKEREELVLALLSLQETIKLCNERINFLEPTHERKEI